MRNDRQAHIVLAKQAESVADKVARLAASNMPYKVRLAAILATDNNRGKVWA